MAKHFYPKKPGEIPLTGEMRVNTTLERAEVFDGGKWVELAPVTSVTVPVGAGAVGSLSFDPKEYTITAGGGLTGISSLAASTSIGIRDGERPKTAFNTHPRLKVSEESKTISKLSHDEFVHSLRGHVHEWVKEQMPECAECFHLKFNEEVSFIDGTVICQARCNHKGASAGCTTIICPSGRMSTRIEGQDRAVFIPMIARMTRGRDEECEVESEPYIRKDADRPATPDADAW